MFWLRVGRCDIVSFVTAPVCIFYKFWKQSSSSPPLHPQPTKSRHLMLLVKWPRCGVSLLLPVCVWVSLRAYRRLKHLLGSLWSPRLMGHICQGRKSQGTCRNGECSGTKEHIWDSHKKLPNHLLQNYFHWVVSSVSELLWSNTYYLWKGPSIDQAEIVLWHLHIRAVGGLFFSYKLIYLSCVNHWHIYNWELHFPYMSTSKPLVSSPLLLMPILVLLLLINNIYRIVNIC